VLERMRRIAAMAWQRVIAVLFLSALGSGLWSVVIAPGGSKVLDAIAKVLTLGSERLSDAPFASAALDPTPVPSLLILTYVSVIPVFGFLHFLDKGVLGNDPRKWADKQLRQIQEQVAADSGLRGRDLEAEVSQAYKMFLLRMNRLGKWLSGLMVLMFGALAALTALAFSITSTAITLHRYFQADMAVLAPALSADQEESARAQWSNIRTEKEYRELYRLLLDRAEDAGVTLRGPRLPGPPPGVDEGP